MPLHKFNNPGLVYYKALSKYLELVKESRKWWRCGCRKMTRYARLSRPRRMTTAPATEYSRRR